LATYLPGLETFLNLYFFQFYPKFAKKNLFQMHCFLTKLNNLSKIFINTLKGRKHTFQHYSNTNQANFFHRDRSFKIILQPGLGAEKVENHCPKVRERVNKKVLF
jgi:hypothetical protein